jgi:hypothetical protein
MLLLPIFACGAVSSLSFEVSHTYCTVIYFLSAMTCDVFGAFLLSADCGARHFRYVEMLHVCYLYYSVARNYVSVLNKGNLKYL